MTLLAHAQRLIELDKTATPGPWAVHPILAQIDAMSTPPIPVCQMLWPTDHRSEAETLANAALVAAARTSPDVAKALIEAAKHLRWAMAIVKARPATPGRNYAEEDREDEADKFLATLTLPDAGQGRV